MNGIRSPSPDRLTISPGQHPGVDRTRIEPFICCDVDWNSHHRAGASASHRFQSAGAQPTEPSHARRGYLCRSAILHPSGWALVSAMSRGYVDRPSRRIVQASMLFTLSIPFRAQLSSASRSHTASSEGADIACSTPGPFLSGPPRTMKPSSTRQSIDWACSSQSSCSRRSRDQSQGPPRSRRTAKNTRGEFGRHPLRADGGAFARATETA